MSADRWSDETQDLVAEAIVDHAWLTETDSQSIAGLALAALADAGLLVEPGSEDTAGDEIAQAIFDVLDDAMVPGQPDENGDDHGQWISDLPPDLLTERIVAALGMADLLLPDHAEREHPDDWPAMAEGVATRAIREALPDIALSAPNMIARRIMADLVGADLLAVPGETRQEWGVSYPNLHPEPVRCEDEDMARHTAGAAFGRKVMVRTVHTGPWRETSHPTAPHPCAVSPLTAAAAGAPGDQGGVTSPTPP